jgi:hypothetical protein
MIDGTGASAPVFVSATNCSANSVARLPHW